MILDRLILHDENRAMDHGCVAVVANCNTDYRHFSQSGRKAGRISMIRYLFMRAD
jgi:hypothetical protein